MAVARSFVEKHGFTFPMVADPERAVVNAYDATFPSVYVIDRDGRGRFRNVGYRRGGEAILEAQVKSVLGK